MRKVTYLKETFMKRELEKNKRMAMMMADLVKLKKQGFRITSHPFRNSSTSRNVLERRIAGQIKKEPKRELWRRLRIKKVQHGDKNIKVYIVVVKKR